MIHSENVNAEYAVAVTGDNFSEMFAGMDDAYMKARAVDVKDIYLGMRAVVDGFGKETNGRQGQAERSGSQIRGTE